MMTKNIKDILNTYNFILENKKIVFGESDISGIDELVYNPATKSGGSIGHGYDGGKKVNGITWSNHDNHLHIGFTNRDVAMAVINKADQLGLKTTENPYAKKDPNGKVDTVHTSGSFHYKVFPGEPKVGAGVDISGNPNTITELIKWVEKTYVGGSYPEQKTNTQSTDNSSGSTSVSSTSGSGEDSMVSDIAGDLFGKILGVNEQKIRKTKYFITFCNISNLKSYRNGQDISNGDIIGTTNTDVNVSKYDENYSRINLLEKDFKLGKDVNYSFGNATIPFSKNDKIKSPISGVVNNSKYISNCKNQLTIEASGKIDGDDKFKPKNTVRSGEYSDPLVGDILAYPFKIFSNKYDDEGKLKQKRYGYGGNIDPWIVDTISAPFKKIGKIFKEEQEKKIIENIDKIKRLL